DVGEIDEPLRLQVLGAGRRHVVGVDVVELAIGAETQAGGHRHHPPAPERFEEFQVDASQVADKAKPAGHLVMYHRFRQEACGVTCTNADGRVASFGNGCGEALVEQATQHHDSDVAGFAVGDTQAIHEAALDAHL